PGRSREVTQGGGIPTSSGGGASPASDPTAPVGDQAPERQAASGEAQAPARSVTTQARPPAPDAHAVLAARLRFLQEKANRLAAYGDPEAEALADRVLQLSASILNAGGGTLQAAAGALGKATYQNLVRFADAVTRAQRGIRRLFENAEGEERERLRALNAAYQELDALTREVAAAVVALNMDKRAASVDLNLVRGC
ncbi:hypothetical protein ACFL59_09900, partial [Planctomycetota bacterium]